MSIPGPSTALVVCVVHNVACAFVRARLAGVVTPSGEICAVQ